MASDHHGLRDVVEHVAHLLPAQGPISVFIHHNVLHAFEGSRFEDAVVEAARIYGARAFWPAETYRALFETGRITDDDLRAVIDEELGARGEESIAGIATRRELAFRTTRHGVPDIRGPGLEWHLAEEAKLDAATWSGCLSAVERTPEAPREAPKKVLRHRDAVLEATGVDIDDDVHALLVRFVSAYLDQGLALWAMPDREDGLFAAFLRAYRRRWMAPLLGPWGKDLVALLEIEAKEARDSLDSLAASLDALGIGEAERESFLLSTALALKGWAGMVRQLEVRPDRVPVWPVPARLADFLAVRLLVERAVLAHVSRTHRISALRMTELARAPVRRTAHERAFPLYHLARLFDLDAARIAALSPEDIATLERFLGAHHEDDEARWLHCAFELHLRSRFFDALTMHRADPLEGRPFAQAIFCVDEREESIRRHVEEVDDRIETLSTAGFFGVAMYHQGVRDARPRPLAPVAIRPRHFVPMEVAGEGVARGFAREIGRVRAQTLHVGSRSLVRGAIVSVVGAASLVPLVLRVLFPRRLAGATLEPRAQGKLLVDRVERATPPVGELVGYAEAEMVDIVFRVLGELGLTGSASRFARLVVVVGHAADSINNPHRSAYDCGACGGGPGGANARAFAIMANRASVRAKLRDKGLAIPDTTRFVAAQHNTTDDSVTWFDEADVPESHAHDFARARASFAEACERNAEERGRRFARDGDVAPTGEDALDAVAKRRWDLAEPRPEYNHATNAVCVVGRRERTRGLFLDRRAFLVSYDPTRDDEAASTLSRVLEAVVPVVVGINLEYFFGAIDNEVYGAGSKLPHNVASLIGVMNGAHGDLRTGLWSQTVEIHEPVRVTMVVEATPERLAAVVAASKMLSRLVENRWLFLAALSPDGPEVHDFASGTPRLHVAKGKLPVVSGRSASWFRGKRDHLAFVDIEVESTR